MVGNTQPDWDKCHKTLRTMKKMKRTIYALVIALLIAGNSFGQAIDQKRMDRDLEIAENILQTLSNSGGNRYFYSSSSESRYIPNFGVIFSLNNSFGVRIKKSEQMFKEQATAFLVDYADLIGQLKPSDKIRITAKSSNNNFFNAVIWMDDSDKKRQSTGRTAEILKSDLIAYKQGKSNREAIIEKIKFATTTKDEKVERDLELFGSIFAKLYDADLSTTYYTSSHRVNYERLDNFGAIYNMRVYSSTSDNGLHTIRTTRERGLTKEERDKKVNDMYPEFEHSVKENILDYGRTIKSLSPNEMLIFKIRLTECNECEMPRSIELSVKATVLSDYGSGKTTRDKAMSAITLKKSSN